MHQDHFSPDISAKDCIISSRFVTCMIVTCGWCLLLTDNMSSQGQSILASAYRKVSASTTFSSFISDSMFWCSRSDNKDLGRLGEKSQRGHILMYFLRRYMDTGILYHGSLGRHSRM